MKNRVKKMVISIMLMFAMISSNIVPIYSAGMDLQDEEKIIERENEGGSDSEGNDEIDLSTASSELRNVEIKVTNFDEPVKGAAVTLDEEEFITNEAGSVVFENVKISSNSEDLRKIRVQAEDYGTITCDVRIPAITNLNENIDDAPNYVLNLFYKKEKEKHRLQPYSLDEVKDWEEKSLMPTKIGDNLSAVVDDLIYVVEKFEPQTMYVYNTTTDVWNSIDIGVNESSFVAMFAYNGKIYLMGSTILVYDIQKATWQSYNSEKYVSDKFGSFIYEGKIYNLNEEYAYNLVNNTWVKNNDFPSEITYSSYCFIEGNYLYAIDFIRSLAHTYNLNSKQLDTLEIQDFSKEFYLKCCSLGTKLYMFGGVVKTPEWVESWTFGDEGEWIDEGFWEYIEEPTDFMYTYDFSNSELTRLLSYLPTDSATHSLSACNGKAYIIGGALVDYITKNSEIYAYELDEPSSVKMSGTDCVASGDGFTLYINGNGELMSSGSNNYGQLGTGDIVDVDRFVKVQGSWNDKKIIKVVAGMHSVYALTEDNILYSWGRNDNGQLGDGSNTDRYSPVYIMDNVADVVAGDNHAIALKTDGTVYGWGQNNFGQLASNGNQILTPTEIYAGAKSIGAGSNHTFVIDTNGSLYATGKNDRGQLCIGNNTNKNSFVFVSDNIVQATGGYNHTAVIDSDGQLLVGGDNTYGQLGII